MGWETLAVVGFSALSGRSQMKQAKSQAGAIAREAEYQATQLKDRTLRQAGSLTTSYLNSGIALEGGPTDIIARAFARGRTDIERLKSSADAQSKNVINDARSKMLKSLGTSVMGAAGGFDLGGTASDLISTGVSYLPDSAAFAMNDLGFGDIATDALMKSDKRLGLY